MKEVETMNLISRSEIGLKKPTKALTKLKAPAKGLAIHWEGTKVLLGDLDQSKKTLKAVQNSHLNNKAEGYIDIAYNLAFDYLGNIFELRGWDNRSGANGTTKANDEYIAVVYLGGPDTPFTPEAKKALQEIRQAANAKGVGPETKPHSAFKATQCPGVEITNFIKDFIGGTTPAPAAPVSNMPAAPVSSMPAFSGLQRRGAKNTAVYQFQAKLRDRGWKITVDGIFGPRTEAIIRQFQAEKGLVVDGLVGEKTWAAIWHSPVT